MDGLKDNNIRIWRKDGALLVEINFETGALTYGPNYTPDEAAKRFWEGIEQFRSAA